MKKRVTLRIREEWCKGCGICVSFCPKHVLELAVNNKVVVTGSDDCIGCGQCQLRCPDFAIEVEVQTDER